MTELEFAIKLALLETEQERIDCITQHCITQEDGVIVVTPREESDLSKVDVVVCAYARPDAFRTPGSIDVECDGCGTLIILSPTSPVKPRKLCFKCCDELSKGVQTINE